MSTDKLTEWLQAGSDLIVAAMSGTTGIWVYFRFRKEGAHEPRIEFDVDCAFLGIWEGRYAAAVSIYAENKGHVQHTRTVEVPNRLLSIFFSNTLPRKVHPRCVSQ